MFRDVLRKTWNSVFLHRCRTVAAKKCTKKHDARTELLSCQSQPTAFLPFSLTSPSSLLEGDVTGDDSQATIFSATQRYNIVATLFRILTTLFQHCKALVRGERKGAYWRGALVWLLWPNGWALIREITVYNSTDDNCYLKNICYNKHFSSIWNFAEEQVNGAGGGNFTMTELPQVFTIQNDFRWIMRQLLDLAFE